jgi:translation elongation factor aEF-1 beta
MGMSAVQFKLMPEGLDINLEDLTLRVNKNIKELGGNPSSSEEVPIAFGLKAVVFSFAFPEEKEIEEVEKVLSELEGVSSVELIDYRRALG